MPQQPRRTHRADVMVSSTSYDLAEHRKAVIDAIWRAGMFALSMERDTAVPHADAISYSLQLVDESEVYIGLFGMRYGYVPNDDRNPKNISLTEMEYRRARERGIPMLLFIMNEKEHLIPAIQKSDGETKKQKKQLESLKNELKDKHIVDDFTSVDDLRAKVTQSLYELKIQGIIDTSQDDTISSSSATTYESLGIPAPPEIHSVPPYILTNKFIGRGEEIKKLNDWTQSNDSIMVLQAIGGMGKSALAWEWVTQAHKDKRFDGIIWWSFYESGATIDGFIRHALAYITRTSFDELNDMSYQERMSLLLDELNKGNYLLGMDGLERILVAYHRINKAQIQDNEVGEDADLRNCIDPRDSDFLYKLIGTRRSKILISTRLMPRALEDAGDPILGVGKIHLKGLLSKDAHAFLRERGVKNGDEEKIEEVLKSIGYHGLVIKIIGGYIKNYKRGPGDFDAWYQHRGKDMNLAEMAMSERRTHILQDALTGLEQAEDGVEKKKILCQMAAFSDPVNYHTLSIFNPYLPPQPPPPDLPALPQVFPSPFGSAELAWLEHQLTQTRDPEERTEWQAKIDRQREIDARADQYRRDNKEKLLKEEAEVIRQRERIREDHERKYKGAPLYLAGVAAFDNALTELEDWGLLQWDRENDSYDLHPVVRGYAFGLLQEEERKTTFGTIRDHFAEVPEVEMDNIWEISDVQEMLEVYRALLGTGEVDYAVAFYMQKLKKILFDLSANYRVIECLAPIFAGDYESLPPVTHASHIAHYLAMAFGSIGEIEKSLQLARLNINPELGHNEWEMHIRISTYSSKMRDLNKIAEYWYARKLSSEICPPVSLAWGHLDMAISSIHIGDWDSFDEYYNLALEADTPNSHPIPFIGRLAYYKARALVFQEKDAELALEEALTAVTEAKENFMILAVKGLWAQYELQRRDFAKARPKIVEAIKLAQETGESASLYFAMLSIVESASRNQKQARIWLNKATDNRNVLDGGKAINYVYISDAYLALGDSDSAKHYAQEAYRYAWADGGKFVNAYPLKLASQLLDNFGIPHPTLPELHPEQVPPMPYEDEIRRIYIENAGTLSSTSKTPKKQPAFNIQGCTWIQIGTIAVFGVEDADDIIEAISLKLTKVSFLPTTPQLTRMGNEVPVPKEFKLDIERSRLSDIDWAFDELRNHNKTFAIVYFGTFAEAGEPAYAYVNVRVDRLDTLLDKFFSGDVFNLADYATIVETGVGELTYEDREKLRRDYLFGEHYLNVRIFPPLSDVT